MAQLINSETGHHIWAERYDRNLKDIFELQDEIAQRIAGIFSPELERVENKRHGEKQRSYSESWNCCLQGRSLLAEFNLEKTSRRVSFLSGQLSWISNPAKHLPVWREATIVMSYLAHT
jgi:hypothetical protein